MKPPDARACKSALPVDLAETAAVFSGHTALRRAASRARSPWACWRASWFCFSWRSAGPL